MTPFLIGIDLGTTNSACAFVDTRTRDPRAQLFAVPQLVEPFIIEPRPVLPSFLYFGETPEIESGALELPWSPRPDSIAGVLARERGAVAPARQVASAKSWLAHPAIDRRAAILPWGADSGPRISPVDASARYLAHIRDAWDATIAGRDDRLRFEHQRIVLTVPASFDEEARELTVEAARAARFARLTLLEEPIATFYAWLSEHHTPGDLGHDQIALVCDVGGGTTDFSLIRVCVEHGGPSFGRIAIGEHLLLGGDNVDVALATLLERRIIEARPSTRLAITQRAALRRICSAAKERMLGEAPPGRVPVTILGSGRSVIGESVATELTWEDVERTLNDFLPLTAPGDLPAPRDRRAGLRELGLPYESEPAITRHLAAFLHRSSAALPEDHRAMPSIDGRMVRPDLLLFNGGFFTPALTRARVVEALAAWFGEAPRLLATSNLEAAVAIGAATYARLRAGVGPSFALVRAGSGRAYYIGLHGPRLDEATPVVCVLARGTAEGTAIEIEHPFTVATNRPISFSLYSSTIRSEHVGDIVSLGPDDDTREHAPVVAVLRYGRKSRTVDLPVRLSVAFTEVGTLELWCKSQVSEHRWRLQFQLRGAAPEGLARTSASDDGGAGEEGGMAEIVISQEAQAAGEQAIRCVFEGSDAEVTSESLLAHLEQLLGYGKTAWPLGVIRRFADTLIAVAGGRRRSPALEARWLNLFGFCVRPGLGAAKDAWRIGEARTVYAAGLAFPRVIQNRVEWLVAWQRAGGGFSAGQQRELAQRVMGELGLTGKRGPRPNPQIEREGWRLLASLERLDAALRVRIGDELMRRLHRDPDNASLLWAIGRLGARVPLYGPLSSVVSPHDAGQWLDELVASDESTPELLAAIVQLGAMTGDPLRDVDQEVLARARQRVRADTVDEAGRPLFEMVASTIGDMNRVFGEPLPDALQLVSRPSGS